MASGAGRRPPTLGDGCAAVSGASVCTAGDAIPPVSSAAAAPVDGTALAGSFGSPTSRTGIWLAVAEHSGRFWTPSAVPGAAIPAPSAAALLSGGQSLILSSLPLMWFTPPLQGTAGWPCASTSPICAASSLTAAGAQLAEDGCRVAAAGKGFGSAAVVGSWPGVTLGDVILRRVAVYGWCREGPCVGMGRWD